MIRFKKVHPFAVDPVRHHDNDSGIDLTPVHITKQISADRFRLGTGWAVQPPEGYYFDLINRSSTDKKLAITAFGVIDADYTGELQISVKLDSPQHNVIDLLNEPLCQLVLHKLHVHPFEIVEDFEKETERGEGGFGHTDDKDKSDEV